MVEALESKGKDKKHKRKFLRFAQAELKENIKTRWEKDAKEKDSPSELELRLKRRESAAEVISRSLDAIAKVRGEHQRNRRPNLRVTQKEVAPYYYDRAGPDYASSIKSNQVRYSDTLKKKGVVFSALLNVKRTWDELNPQEKSDVLTAVTLPLAGRSASKN